VDSRPAGNTSQDHRPPSVHNLHSETVPPEYESVGSMKRKNKHLKLSRDSSTSLT
jgi:hypothetical protein